MIAKMGQDGHDRGQKSPRICRYFDVDIGPLFQTPAEAAKQAIENDVHSRCSLAAGQNLGPSRIAELKNMVERILWSL
jgi:methylmalonyl-CoA mutase